MKITVETDDGYVCAYELPEGKDGFDNWIASVKGPESDHVTTFTDKWSSAEVLYQVVKPILGVKDE